MTFIRKFEIGDKIVVQDQTENLANVNSQRSYEKRRWECWVEESYFYSRKYKVYTITGVSVLYNDEYKLDSYTSTVFESWLIRVDDMKDVDNGADTILDMHTPGAKDDKEKPPVALVFESFPRALLAIAEVAGDGAKKYTRGGWKQVKDGENRYANASGRHELKQYIEGETDQDSGSLHLAHIAWNVLARLELRLKQKAEN